MKVYQGEPYNGIGQPNRRFTVEAEPNATSRAVRDAVRKAAGTKRVAGLPLSDIEVNRTAHPKIWDVWVWYDVFPGEFK